jgi:hypothetical protein
MFLRKDPGLSIPGNDENWPRGAAQYALGHRSLSEPPPSASSVGSQNNHIDFPGVRMEHDHAGGIAVLLFDAHLHAGRFGAFPKMAEVFEPLGCSRGESNVGRSGVKQKQLGVTHHGEPERAVKCWFARLLEIYCAENPREVPHAITSMDVSLAVGRCAAGVALS